MVVNASLPLHGLSLRVMRFVCFLHRKTDRRDGSKQYRSAVSHWNKQALFFLVQRQFTSPIHRVTLIFTHKFIYISRKKYERIRVCIADWYKMFSSTFLRASSAHSQSQVTCMHIGIYAWMIFDTPKITRHKENIDSPAGCGSSFHMLQSPMRHSVRAPSTAPLQFLLFLRPFFSLLSCFSYLTMYVFGSEGMAQWPMMMIYADSYFSFSKRSIEHIEFHTFRAWTQHNVA